MHRTFVLLLLFASVLPAQRLSFETASVKPSESPADSGTMGVRGQRFVATNVPLKALLVFAFTSGSSVLREDQMAGMPAWGENEPFDVVAVSEGTAGELPLANARSMLQSLLEERFSLRFHPESRELRVYDLVLNKRGPKLSENQTAPEVPRASRVSYSQSAGSATPVRGTAQFSMGPGVMTIAASAITTSTLIDLLQGQTDRMIFDRTELKSLFDVRLEFAPSRGQNAESGASSVFTALQDLGFRLESAKAPVDVIVIDSVQKPSAN